MILKPLVRAVSRRLIPCAVVSALLAGAAAGQTLTPIAAIQASPATYTGTQVTVEGVVTVPINYRGPTLYTGYIQDGSGHGINLFGGATQPPNAAALNTVGSRVRVTGEVQIFSTTTIEIVNFTEVTPLGTTAPVTPIRVSTAGANDARWEGTRIEVAGNVISSVVASGARNYTLNDGSGAILARVYTGLGVPTIADGTPVIARGAGTNFAGTFQFYVGEAADFAAGTPPTDTTPPALVGAWSPGATSVVVTFAEPVQAGSGGNAANYVLSETANPGNTVAVSSVSVAGPVATLTLGANLGVQTNYTLQVSNVQDTAGNAIGTPATLPFRSGGMVDTTAPNLQSATAPSGTSVTATFSEPVSTATAGNAANWAVFETANMSNTVPVMSVAVAGATATLTLNGTLTAGAGYTVRASNIADLAGNVITAPQTRTFTAPGGGGSCPGAITIASIQANPSAFDMTVVTIQGQVYIPTNYRGATISGYIQDSSGRGINVFGSTGNDPRLQDAGNIVCITGTIDLFFTTVEITNLTSISVVSSGNPPLAPVHLTTGAAASAQWEGTFIEVTGDVISSAVSGPGRNYTINDGSGPVDVRVVDTLTGVPVFSNGTEITARGAGSQFSTTFQVLVGRSSDVFMGGGGGDTTPPSLLSASAASLGSVAATFNEPVSTATAGNAANWAVFETANMSNTVAVSSVAVSGATATLTLGGTLTAGTGYTVRASNIADIAGNVITAPQTRTFTAPGGGGNCPGAITIASIQANPSAFDMMVVTIQGQVYIPTNYRGATISGYIQDSSGRGINVFGSTGNDPRLQDAGNIVCITGTIDLFFTTVEITNLTSISVVSSGNPPLTPVHLTTGAAASAQWEGTFIEVTGDVISSAVSGPGRNYTINDGSGPVDVRVVDTLTGVPVFSNGTEITARGAGSQFSTTFQVLVGRSSDVFMGGGGPDITPPSLTSAAAPSLGSVAATFSEPVSAATAGNAANWAVFETANMSNTVAVSSVAVSGATATLTLGGTLTAGTGYTVRASNIADLAGNVITAPQTRTFTAPGGGGNCPGAITIASIQANPSAFDMMVVTIQGQVYIPTNYRGATISGYIQDSSGRGINVFGSTAGDPRLQDAGNIVCITGTIDLFFTTVEITNLTSISVVSSGNPPLAPVHLTTGAAASAQWEGTFIEVTGDVISSAVSGPGRNYTINDGTGPVDVRVVDTLTGVPVFPNGTEITARGAGSQFSTTFQVLVGRTSDVFAGGGGPDTTPPLLTGAAAPSLGSVAATFNEPVSAATAGNAANWAVFETANASNTLPVSSAAVTGASVTLTLGGTLTAGTGYTVRASNIADLAGNVITAPLTRTFTAPGGGGNCPGAITIASIQENPMAFDGMVVTVQGQVYIPSNYRGTTSSGYIQDSSGRGINLFGSTTNDPRLQDISNIVCVTGTVELFFTTVEITGLTNISLISTGNPPLPPTSLTTGAAASSDWEGTFISVTGAIFDIVTQAAAVNYSINDGTGPVVVRVVSTVPAPMFTVGQTITARGAGSQFQSDFQILIGRVADVFEVIDTTPQADAVTVSGPPFTFLPRQGESYPITFTVTRDIAMAGEVQVRIFDLQGRLKKTVFDSRFDALSANRATRDWNGRDDVEELVPAGTYVVHVLAVSSRTGERREAQMPVVVATRLKR